VEPTSTPWRVFDSPADRDGGAGAAGSAALQVPARSLTLPIAGLVGAVAVGIVAILIAMSSTGGEVVDGPVAALGTFRASGLDASSGEIVVDVAGAVANPGIFHLAPGSRVGDAIEAAGGFSPRVDVARVGAELNLAATLADGAQVRVPSRDEPAPAGTSSAAVGGGLVNLNTATEAQLDALSGIGPVTAGKIIDSRATAPFRTVDELRERGLVGQKTFEKIRAQLTVG
jgi:competence protein ComEA